VGESHTRKTRIWSSRGWFGSSIPSAPSGVGESETVNVSLLSTCGHLQVQFPVHQHFAALPVDITVLRVIYPPFPATGMTFPNLWTTHATHHSLYCAARVSECLLVDGHSSSRPWPVLSSWEAMLHILKVDGCSADNRFPPCEF
jgi:hypothetical protein